MLKSGDELPQEQSQLFLGYVSVIVGVDVRGKLLYLSLSRQVVDVAFFIHILQ